MKRKINKSAKTRELLADNPDLTADDLAKKLKVTKQYAYSLLWQASQGAKKKKKRGRPAKAKAVMPNFPVVELEDDEDLINSPSHYKHGGIETIDFIEAKDLGYHLGNVVKYLSRASYKGNYYDDLCKAKWYLDRAIENLEVKID